MLEHVNLIKDIQQMINELKPVCFSHPITTIFLDDNRAFLDVLELEFSNKINMLTYTSPDDALCSIFNHKTEINPKIIEQIKNVDSDTHNQVISFEIKKIFNLIYDRNRFTRIAIVIIDYEMPNINGIDFCKKIDDKNIYKIILTAEADKDIAIQAFNEGIISKFIFKTCKNLNEELTFAFKELQHQYFKNLSGSIVEICGSQLKLLLEEKLYQTLFRQILLETEAVEYYLFDNSGSFLFLNKNAHPTWLIVRHKNELEEQVELLKGYDADPLLISAIVKKEKLLFLLSENEYKKPMTEWIKYIFDAKQLNEDYYYSIIHDKITDFIEWEQVIPYARERSFNCVSIKLSQFQI